MFFCNALCFNIFPTGTYIKLTVRKLNLTLTLAKITQLYIVVSFNLSLLVPWRTDSFQGTSISIAPTSRYIFLGKQCSLVVCLFIIDSIFCLCYHSESFFIYSQPRHLLCFSCLFAIVLQAYRFVFHAPNNKKIMEKKNTKQTRKQED